MIRKIARPMLASVYIADGVDTLVNSSEHVESSERFLKQVRSVVPAEYQRYVPKDAELVAQALGGTKVGAGALYALGKAPRFAAGTLQSPPSRPCWAVMPSGRQTPLKRSPLVVTAR